MGGLYDRQEAISMVPFVPACVKWQDGRRCIVFSWLAYNRRRRSRRVLSSDVRRVWGLVIICALNLNGENKETPEPVYTQKKKKKKTPEQLATDNTFYRAPIENSPLPNSAHIHTGVVYVYLSMRVNNILLLLCFV